MMKRMSYDEARIFCETNGMHLVALETEDEEKMLEKYMKDEGTFAF